ncbi:MAG: nucleotidyl transferase AbiEii/AbiGii toxin family protein [Patescibacteria group bacterium]
MLIPRSGDAVHRAWMLRLLSAIADDRTLLTILRFKGGTCAAMQNLLNRFSVDLDFDLLSVADIPRAKERLQSIFRQLDLTIKDQSKTVTQYFLRYDAPSGQRNTIALDITVPPPQSNEYETIRFADIDRFIPCQTIGTMVANKLVTSIDRFEKHGAIAGRDIYDIHHFLLQGYPCNIAVIEERAQIPVKKFSRTLRAFIGRHVTQTIIDQDLNTLLPPGPFQKIRRILKRETIALLRQWESSI